jgi:hypothetical protein
MTQGCMIARLAAVSDGLKAPVSDRGAGCTCGVITGVKSAVGGPQCAGGGSDQTAEHLWLTSGGAKAGGSNWIHWRPVQK